MNEIEVIGRRITSDNLDYSASPLDSRLQKKASTFL